VGDDGEGRREGVGEAVVAVDAGYFFDEVDLALKVEAPAGELGGVDAGGGGSELAAEGGEVLVDGFGGDAGGVDGGA